MVYWYRQEAPRQPMAATNTLVSSTARITGSVPYGPGVPPSPRPCLDVPDLPEFTFANLSLDKSPRVYFPPASLTDGIRA